MANPFQVSAANATTTVSAGTTVGNTAATYGVELLTGPHITVTNSGVILGTDGVVVAGTNNTIVNASGGYIGGNTSQYGAGVYFNQGTTSSLLINAGTIKSHLGVDSQSPNVTVNNQAGGYILGNGGSSVYGYGGSSGMVLVNAGRVVAENTTYEAVGMKYGGSIINQPGGLIDSVTAHYAVLITGGPGTLTNAGTIDGSITLATNASNRVIVDPGAVFNLYSGNHVSGGGGYLELASGTSTGTLNLSSASFTSFATLRLDSGSSWIIKADSGLTSDIGTISGFAATDTIQIAGHATITGQTTSAGVVHVTLAGAGAQTLNFLGALPTLQAVYSGGITSLDEPTGPTLTTGGTVTFTGGGSAVVLDATAAITDTNNVTSATIAIASGFVAGDQLNFTNQSGITGSFNASTGTLVLTGNTSAAAFQSAIDSITFSFSPTNGDPTQAGNHPTRTIDWRVADATGSSSLTTSGIITNLSSILNYGETIVETGIVATSETVAAGAMTLASTAVVGHVTVGTSLSTGEFLLSNDGTNSTIVLDTVFGTYMSGVTLLTDPTTIASTGKAINTAGNGRAVTGPSGTTWTLVNNGLVQETASGGIGVSFASAGTVVNAGQIIGNRTDNSSIGVSLANGGTVSNQAAGTIEASFGIQITGAAGSVVNLGSIIALDTVGGINGRYGVALSNGGKVVNGASGGTISSAYISGYYGGVKFGATGTGTLINYGAIYGRTREGGVYDGAAVTLNTGTVINGPSGDTSARISANANSAVRFNGAGTVFNYGTILDNNAQGGGSTAPFGMRYYGVDLTAGGVVKNLGSASLIKGYVGVYGKGGVTVTNAGTIAENTPDSGAYLAPMALEFGSGTNRLIVDGGAVFVGEVSGTGTTTGTSTLEFATAGASGAIIGTIGGLGSQFVNFQQITVDVGAHWSIIGYDSIASGVTLTDSGTATVLGTLVNAGRITGPSRAILLGTGGRITNAIGGTITSNGVGVAGSGNGTLVNYGVVSGATGSGLGVSFAGAGTVTNQSGGVITGYAAIFGNAAPFTVANAGLLLGNTTAGSAYGVLSYGGLLLTNLSTGTIAGHQGVNVQNVAGTVSNAGTVRGTTLGVYLEAGGTVTNTGVIAGPTDAVKFKAGFTNRLVVGPTASFTGNVDGGNTIGAALISTLELASGASTGRLNGFGSQFVHFAQITVDAGAQWSIASGLSGFATLTDAGTVTNGVSLGNGTLTVSVQSGGVINGGAGYGIYDISGAATVVNAGQISAASAAAVLLVEGGAVTNLSGGTITGSGGASYGYAAILGEGFAETVTNSGVIDGTATNGTGVLLHSGGVVSNQSGGTIESAYIGVHFSFSPATLVNAGVISGNASAASASGVSISAGGSVTNQSGGTISGYLGIDAINTAATVVNAGVIDGTDTLGGTKGVYLGEGGAVTNLATGTISGGYYGVEIAGARGTVVNLGRIVTHDNGFGRNGVYLAAGGLVINGASGGTASSAYILGYSGAVRFGTSGTGTLVNFGTLTGTPGYAGVIMATGTVINGPSGATGAQIISGGARTAIEISNAGTVVNYGTIQGIAFNGQGTLTYGVSVGGSGSVASTISNLGSKALITGYVAVYAAQNATVTNGGTLYATQMFGGTPPQNALIFGGGTNRLIIDPGAVFIGTVHGSGPVTLTPAGGGPFVLGTANGTGTATLELASAATAGTISGIGSKYVGFGQITVDSGAQWAIAGSNSIVSGETLTNSGTDTVAGTLINAGLATGTSTALVLGAGGQITNVSGGIIAATGASGIAVRAAGAGTVVNAGVITGDSASGKGVALLGGGWVINQSGGTLQGSVGAYGNGGATISNAGLIAGTATIGAGIYVYGTASVTNQAGGTITGGKYGLRDVAGTTTLTNAGTISATYGTFTAAFLGASGTIVNQSGGLITGANGIEAPTGALTVINAGSIAGRTSVAVGQFYGVAVRDGGLVSNQAGGVITGRYAVGASVFGPGNTSPAFTVVNAGQIAGSQYGVDMPGGGSVTNLSGGTITSGFVGIGAANSTVTVVNAGLVSASGGQAIFLTQGGQVINQAGGTVYGLGVGAIDALNATATIVNAGLISGSSTGIYLGTGGTVTNQSGGTIAGGTDAVLFHSGNTGRLVIDPGATFVGTVDGGNTIGAASASTLELASGASAGTLNGVGSQYINFSQITIDAGAQWDVIGSDAATALGGATITGFSYGDTIDITNFNAGSETFDGRHLTLTSGASSVTLSVPGGFITQNFRITNDGGSGTDITLGVAVLHYGDTINEAGVVATSETVNAGHLTLFNSGNTAVGAIGVGTTLNSSDFQVSNNGTNSTIVVATVFGTYTSPITLDVLSTTIAGTASVSTTLAAAAAVTAPGGTAWTLTNNGQVSGTGSGRGYGVNLSAGSILNNFVSGTITGYYAGVGAAAGVTVVNNGTILQTGAAGGEVLRFASSGSVNNSGLLGGAGDGITGNGLVVDNTGTIRAIVQAVHFQGVLLNGVSGSSNGLISGGAIGVYVGGNSSTLINYGTIVGGTAITAGTYGGVHANTVVDAGTIIGSGGMAIGLQSAANLMELIPGFAIQGVVNGGSGGATLELASAAAAGTITGLGTQFVGFSQVAVDSGARWTLNGRNSIAGGVTLTDTGTATVTGTLVNDGVVTGTTNGLILGTAALLSNQSGGIISATATNGIAIASSGADTVLNAGILAGNTSTGEGVSFAAGGYLNNQSGGTISGAKAVYAHTGALTVVNAGSILGDASRGHAGVAFAAGGTLSNQSGGVITGAYAVAAYNSAASVINAGGISSSNLGVFLADGGSVTNLSGGSINGANEGVQVTAAAATIVNAGFIIGTAIYGVGLNAGGTVSNQSGGTISGYKGVVVSGTTALVLNAGSIGGTLNEPDGAGVTLRNGAALTNQSGGVIAGAYGVYGTGGATVVNSGSIAGAYNSGVDLQGGGSFTNLSGGTISGGDALESSGSAVSAINAGALLGGDGMLLGAGGSVTNLAQGLISGSAVGILSIAAATVVNAGSITGINGIDLAAGGTIIGQSGVISGATDAVTLASGHTNRVIVYPTARFVGTVDGGNAIGGGTLSTLELASGASTGTIHGIGSQYIDFGQIAFDTGAQWDLVGSDAANALGGATITGFSTGDTIDLTNFAATGSRFIGGELTLSNGGSFVTLDLPGNFITQQFTITNDGSTGTDITLGTARLHYGDTIDEAGIVATSETVNAGGTLTLFNSGNTAVGSIDVGTTLNSSDFQVTNNGTDSTVIVSTVFGTYTSGITLDVVSTTIAATAQATSTIASGAAVYGPSGTTWTLTNYGQVSGTASGGIGVSFASSGTITNASGGTIAAASKGIVLSAGGVVSNVSGGSISGGIYGISAHATATIGNAGVITGGNANGNDHQAGVYAHGGLLTNLSGGTITGYFGFWDRGAAATVINAGSIGGNPTDARAGGVYMYAGGSVTNLSGGVITGIAAIGAVGTAIALVNAGLLSGNPTNSGAGFGFYSSAGGSVTNQSGGTIIGFTGVYGKASALTVTNAGSIGGNATSGIGIDLLAAGTVTNQSGGTIAGFDAVKAANNAATVINVGQINGGTAAGGVGVALGHGGSVTNQSGGSITGHSGVAASGVAATVSNAGFIDGTYGVSLGAGGLVTNASGGTIVGDTGVYVGGGASTVQNAGLIEGTTASGVKLDAGGSVTNQSGGTIIGQPRGVYVFNAAGTVINAGDIAAQATNGSGVFLELAGSVTNASGGTITAGNFGVYLANTAGSVSNAGLIAGSNATGVLFNHGGTLSNLSGGTIAGGSYGVAFQNAFGTASNAGVIDGTTGAGVNFQNGGTLTNQSGGTIRGAADAVKFQAGYANRLVIDPGAVFSGTADGGNAAGATAVSTLELASSTSAGTLTGLGSKYVNFSQITIDSRANWLFTGVNSIASGVTLASSGKLTDTGTLLNAGSMVGNGLYLQGATLTNLSGGVISSSYIDGLSTGGSDTILNQGTITRTAIYLSGAGNVTNASGALITNVYGIKLRGDEETLVNQGQITASASIGAAYAAYLRNGGLIVNGEGNGSTTSTASMQGYYGVTFKSVDTVNQLGTLLNYGTIVGTNTASNAGAALDQGGIVINGADGATGARIVGGRYGVSDFAGTVTNYGTVIATASIAPGYGIYFSSTGLVSNLGSASLIEGFTGIKIGYGTIINQGTIASSYGATGTAIDFAGPGNRLIESPTATLIGGVYGGNGGASVLELASGASAGTITGIGTNIVNFTSLQFDSGAQWTVGGNDAANGLGTLSITGFTIGDTIDLSGFVATSRTFSSNTLVLGNGSSFDTLHISGTFVTNNVHIAADGHGGTDIFIQPIPTIAAGATASFTGGGSPVVLDGSIAITDPNGTLLTGATVEIGTGFVTGDVLAFNGGTDSETFPDSSSITASYNAATGELTLSGTSSIQNYESALDSVTYSFNPGTGEPSANGTDLSRTIEWIASDGSGVAINISVPSASTLNVIHAAPTISVSGTASFSIGGTAAVLDAGATVTDPDSNDLLTGATIAISGGFLSGDVLNFVNTGNVIGSYNASTGTLVLSGTASIAAYDSALASITYSSTAADPSSGATDPARTITWQVTDASSSNGRSNIGTTGLNVYGPPPSIGNTTGTVATYIQQGTAATADGAITVSDGDSATLTGAVVTISNGFLAGDTLAATTSGTSISAVYSNGTLTLTGTDTLAHYQQVLDSITYGSSATDPTNGGADFNRTLTWQVNDGRAEDNLSNVGSTTVSTHVRPVVDASGTMLFAIGRGAVLVDAGVTVTDNDTNPILLGTVAITSGLLSGDVLAFNNGTNAETFGDGATIAASYNSGTGVLSFIESGSVASATDWQQALASVTFNNPGTNPANGGSDPTRTLSWTVDTGDPAQTSLTTTSTVEVAPPPTINGTASGQTTTDEVAISPFSGVTIADLNTGQTETVTITLSNAANGTLSNLGGGSFNNGTYVVTGSVAAVNAAIDGLVFTPTPHQVVPGDTVTTIFTIDDVDTVGAETINSNTTVIATAVNDPPSINATANNVGVPNQGTATPFSVLTVVDPDVGHSDTVTVTMSNPSGGTFSNLSGGSYNSGTGVYTVTGTPSQVNAAINALVFTPSTPAAGSYVSTTDFTVMVTGEAAPPASNTAISVTTVTQVFGLASAPTSNDAVQVSPNGNGFPVATGGKNNEAVISVPVEDGSYSVPGGYQAAFLGGTTDAALTDRSVGDALLVGNSGNDTLKAAAGNDTLLGGTGQNVFSVSGGAGVVVTGSGTSKVTASGGQDSVYASGTSTIAASGTHDVVYAAGTATVSLTGGQQVASGSATTPGKLALYANGAGDTIGAGASTLTGSASGNNTEIYGGFGSIAGPLNVTLHGASDTVNAGNSAATIRASGNNNVVYGGFGTVSAALNVSLSGANDTVNPGGSTAYVNAQGSNNLIYGTFGTISGGLRATLGGAADTVNPGVEAATVLAAASNDMIYGDFVGAGGGLNVSINGGADSINPGLSSAAVRASGSDALILGSFGTTGGALNVWLSGSHDTVNPGVDAATVRAAGNGDLIYGTFGPAAPGLAVVATGPNETVQSGNTPATIAAGAGAQGLWVWGGAGSMLFAGGPSSATVVAGTGNVVASGGSGGLVFYGGAGSSTVSGGAGAMTLYGAASSNIDYSGSGGALLFEAGSGNETLNAAGSSTNDTIVGGSGSDTMTGGGGHDTFIFFESVTSEFGGAHEVVGGFTSNDVVDLIGYSGSQGPFGVANLLSHASSSGGNTTITLSDNTQITFLDVASASALSGHIATS